jgi:hypothetical protein
MAVSVQAETVTPEEARDIAVEFLRHQPVGVGRRVPIQNRIQLKAIRNKPLSDEAAFYVYELEQHGYVLVSADDRVRPVLGYSQNGTYDEQQMPTNMRAWMDNIARQIANVKGGSFARVRKADHYANVSPLLEKDGIHWNQGKPYNNNCPSVSGEKCPTGCVATAAGQIMRYWKYPSQGRGQHSYEWNGKTLSVDFTDHAYNWSEILADYSAVQYNSEQAKAIARLMSDIGISFNMNYAPGGSGANEPTAALAMIEHFKFDSAAQVIYMDYMGVEGFEQAVTKELVAGRPVMMSGATESNTGHEFVCDGVNNNGLYHINWGWGGWYNGDFVLTALYPEGQGTGGGDEGEGYTIGVSAVIGLQPDKGNAPVVELRGERYGIVEDKDAFGRNDAFTVHIPMLMNMGLFTWQGYIGYIICDDQYNIVNNYAVFDYDTLQLDLGYFYYDFYLDATAVAAEVPNGTYKLVGAYSTVPNLKSWKVIPLFNGKSAEMTMIVRSDSILFTDRQAEPNFMDNLRAKKQSEESVLFSWDTPNKAAKYAVKTFITENGEIYDFSYDTVPTNEVLVQFYYPGQLEYSWSVTALDENNKELQVMYGDPITINVTTDYTPTNLKQKVEKGQIHFTWEGIAPYYQLTIIRDGSVIARGMVDSPGAYYNDTSDGEYKWSVRSVNKAQTFYISPEAEATFSLPEDHAIENVESKQNNTKFLEKGHIFIRTEDKTYDLLGR